MKKLSAIVLSLVMLLSLLSYSGFAEGELTYGVLTYEIADGEITITGCADSAEGKIEIPAAIESLPVTAIAEEAFYERMGITEIVIPETVDTIGAGAFLYCRVMEKINIPENLTEIEPDVFHHCQELKAIVIPDSVTKIGDRAFMGCYGLVTVDMGENVTSIGASAFDECVALEDFDFGDKITFIGESAFNRCWSLCGIDIPKGINSLSMAFSSCNGLTEITVPSNVKTVGYHTFYGCRALETITFEEGVTEIYDYALAQCDNLKSVTLPSTITSIGLRAFELNNNLTDVYYNGTQEQWDAIAIGDENEPLLNATLHFVKEQESRAGDLNADGKTNSTDALIVLYYKVGRMELTPEQLELADFNKDN